MPDREKLLKAIEFCRDNASCVGCPYDRECGTRDNAIEDDTLALLREQEPVKPFARYDALRREFDCGACGFLVGFENTFDKRRYRAKYCPECGRRVRWE